MRMMGVNVAIVSLLLIAATPEQTHRPTCHAKASSCLKHLNPAKLRAEVGTGTDAALAKIDHIVVFVLENRSFDNILGVYRNEGAFAQGTNRYDGKDLPIWCDLEQDAILPSIDPGESFADMTFQIYGKSNAMGQPTMGGFAQNFAKQGGSPCQIMHMFSREQVPVSWELAKNYAISDRWFASAPNQTWPNRLFLLTGTAGGYLDNSPDTGHPIKDQMAFLARWPLRMRSLMDELGPQNYRFYKSGISLTEIMLESQLTAGPNVFRSYDDSFRADVAANDLPAFTFIEPRYWSTKTAMISSAHPPHGVMPAERLLAQVYNTLRANEKVWKKTLLIVTYDEHGGIYDSVPPGAAPSPGAYRDLHGAPMADAPNHAKFQFDRYGVRVPVLLISPYIKAGTVYRASMQAQKNGRDYANLPFDHTSVIRTVLDRFVGKQTYLTERDRHAPSLASVLTLPSPRMVLPQVKVPVRPPPDKLEFNSTGDVSDFHSALLLSSCARAKFRGKFNKAECIAELVGITTQNQIDQYLDKLEKAISIP